MYGRNPVEKGDDFFKSLLTSGNSSAGFTSLDSGDGSPVAFEANRARSKWGKDLRESFRVRFEKNQGLSCDSSICDSL